MNEGDPLSEIETRSLDRDFVSDLHDENFLSTSSGGIFNSTPKNGRSLSCLDVSRLHKGTLPDASLQRMRGLSQSICDLKALREKQMGRRLQACVRFEDNFLQEHAKKLEEARMKIRALEAKYCNPRRLRSRSNVSATEDGSREENAEKRNPKPREGTITKDGPKLSPTELETAVLNKTPEESSSIKDINLTKKAVRRSLTEELTQQSPSGDKSDIDSGVSAAECQAVADATKMRTKKRRPVTWADGDDLYSSDTNSVSSQGSGWRRRMDIILEKGADSSERSCYRGYKGNQDRVDIHDSDSYLSFPHEEIILRPQKPTYHTASPHKTTGTLAIQEKSKWHSTPNLSTSYDYDYNQNREMMYGEAIPVDPDQDNRKHNSKFGRRSGLYVVNDSPEAIIIHEGLPVVATEKKKMTFRKKLFHKNNSSKKCPSKYTTVSAPEHARSLGRVVGLHATNQAAYIVELNKPSNGSFGFLIQKGYSQYSKGIFISKIADKKAAKFFGGLLRVGDELVEINNTSVQDQNLASANKLISDSDRLLITVLPYLSRKD